MNDMIEIEQLKTVINQNIELQKEFKRLTSHLIQTIVRLDERVPTDKIDQFSELLRNPLKVDDRVLSDTLRKFRYEMENLANLDILKNVSEIKFIGKRLTIIEDKLDKLIKDEIIHNIDLQFKVDGYKLVKKPISYDKEENIVPSYFEEEQILDDFTDREKLIVKKYLGICGFVKQTFKKIALDCDISPDRISQIFHKVIRKAAISDDDKIRKCLVSLGKTHPLSIVIKHYLQYR